MKSRKPNRSDLRKPFKWPDDGTRFHDTMQPPSMHQDQGGIRTQYVDPDPRLSALRDAASAALRFAREYLTTVATGGSQGDKPLDFLAQQCAREALALMDAMRELRQLRDGEEA
jgi:hypothetical protein